MNTLDSLIVRELQLDARQSSRKLAAKLAVSPTTISNRLKMLVETESLIICCLSDPLMLGFQDRMLFGLKTTPGKETRVARALNEHSSVQNVALLAGHYDLLVYALFQDHRSHLSWITNELGNLKGVIASEEIRILKVVKDNLGYTDNESVASPKSEPKRLDESELKLIRALELNPRENVGTLAHKVGLSRQTTARKLQQLLDEKVIRIVGIPEPTTMGFSGYASIFLTVQLPRMAEVADILARHERITYVSMVSGRYNLLVVVLFKNLDDLSHFLLTDVGNLPGITGRETMIHIGRPRRSFGLARILTSDLAAQG